MCPYVGRSLDIELSRGRIDPKRCVGEIAVVSDNQPSLSGPLGLDDQHGRHATLSTDHADHRYNA